MIEGAGGEIGPDDTQAELERQLDIDKEAQQEQDQPEYTFEYSEIEAPTWEAAMAELGEKVAEDARRLLAYRIKSAREDGSLKRKITLAQKVYANLIAKQQTFADGTSERFLIDGYLASLKARSKAVLTDNPWELFGLSSAGYSSENVSAEELALYEQNDNLGCITVTVRIGENILIVHVEEDHVNLSRKLNYTTRLVKFTVDGKEVVCFVYPHLLPGIGFVASPDRVQVDDLMPTCHEYTDEAIAQLDRAGLSNMVGHMLLLNEQLPEDKRLTIQQIGDMLGGVIDGTAFTVLRRQAGGVDATQTVVTDFVSSGDRLPSRSVQKPGESEVTLNIMPERFNIDHGAPPDYDHDEMLIRQEVLEKYLKTHAAVWDELFADSPPSTDVIGIVAKYLARRLLRLNRLSRNGESHNFTNGAMRGILVGWITPDLCSCAAAIGPLARGGVKVVPFVRSDGTNGEGFQVQHMVPQDEQSV